MNVRPRAVTREACHFPILAMPPRVRYDSASAALLANTRNGRQLNMKTLLAAIAMAAAFASTASALDLDSPNGALRAQIAVNDGVLQYRLELDGQELIAWSPLGLTTSLGTFRSGVKLVEYAPAANIDQPYDLPLGKQAHSNNQARQLGILIENKDGQHLAVRFRAADDGLAIAYHFPQPKSVDVWGDDTSFAFPAGTTSFLHPMAPSKSGWMRTQPSYEEYYLHDHPVGESSPMHQGWCLPALFKVADRGWVLVGETGVSPSFFGARLANDSFGGVYRLELPQRLDHTPESSDAAHVPAGAELPWRFVIVGKALAPIVASTMPTDLVAPLYKFDWQPTPGRATWSWLPLKDENNTEAVQRQFIDMAADLHWEYVLIDALWDKQIGREKIAELVKYAHDKNVKVILWYNSNGKWNDAPQSPRDRMYPAEVRREEMAWLWKIGVKGIKVDFFGGDKQADMALYDGILRDAADVGIVVNFHGATIPRGWDRMYPNFVTCEAVRGMEYCTFEQPNADHEPQHCATLPFTRNAIGPMDFTPLMVSETLSPYRNPPKRKTTLAFELALPVVFFSPVQHFGLVPGDLKTLPPFVLDYLRALPTTWDETRLIDGYPGRFAAIARRKGDRWYIGAINGTEEPLTVSIPADLAANWTAIADEGQNAVAQQSLASEAGKPIELKLGPHAGAVLLSK